MVLIGTTARVLGTEPAAALSLELQVVMQEGLAMASACAACNHKDVATAALSCLYTVVGTPC